MAIESSLGPGGWLTTDNKLAPTEIDDNWLDDGQMRHIDLENIFIFVATTRNS